MTYFEFWQYAYVIVSWFMVTTIILMSYYRGISRRRVLAAVIATVFLEIIIYLIIYAFVLILETLGVVKLIMTVI